ncbi:MAG: cyclophilin-like fold protein [Chloroflexota bacterium]|nr:cyclophilin-like fold protein [Chloroflexota bacterium]
MASTATSAPTTPPPPPASASGTPAEADGQVVGTVVRFSAGSTSVEVTIDEDNPAVRDWLAMLPLTLRLEEFNGREKIAYLPRELAHAGSPGSDPEDGDLIYYVPWGNLGFYYNTAGIGYSDQTIHLGTYNASLAQLEQLEGQEVTVELVP